MKKLKSYEIRQMWLDFFKSKGHEIIPSAPLVPINDPTLLWINAGVAPLKKYFDGREIPNNRRMANAQKSIRTNDIENVGKTARHHTFFEMLGNFSIGDYFREEALEFGFEILTSPQWFNFDLNRLYFTVYPTDIESVNKWVSLGVPVDHIIKLENNFWEIGEGPCGPDTEIFFDRGEKYDPNNYGIRLLTEDLENDRYIEIWNIVFSQYNAIAGLDRSEYPELPSKNIDTGMGLERMACVMQEVETNYDTDLFMPIIKATEEIVGVKYLDQMAFKVIADHVRSVVFAVADGAVLSNEGRGYVLRRILRRAVRYGKKLGMNRPFLYRLVKVVAENMNDYYSYLMEKVEPISNLIKREEEKFLLTLESGEKRLIDYIIHANEKIIPKDVCFMLYDTFGFPLELTLEVAEEYGFNVDTDGFNEELEKQKARARASRSDDQSMNMQNEDMLNFHEDSIFVGYDTLEIDSTVIGLFQNGNSVDFAYDNCLAVFSVTPFYAESGGQIGDIGYIELNGEEHKVTNTTKLPNFQHASMIQLKNDTIHVGDKVKLVVDSTFRNQVMKNHSATHLMNEALRIVAGKHVIQQGSYVSERSLRFDFNNYNLLTTDEILEVEKIVNQEIKRGNQVKISEMALDDAKKLGVQAVFGEKYGDVVRVVDMDFSKELCGGTHVRNTSEIEKFAILSLESKGSGIFRIEAATSSNIKSELMQSIANINSEINDLNQKINDIIKHAKADGINLDYQELKQSDFLDSYQLIINRREELYHVREQVKDLDKKYQKIKKEKNVIGLDEYLTNVLTINGYNVLIFKTYDLEVDVLKDLLDRLSDKLLSSIVFAANIIQDKIIFVCKNKINSLHAGNLVKQAAISTNGNGGGRSDFAQAGGKDQSKLDAVLTEIKEMIENKI